LNIKTELAKCSKWTAHSIAPEFTGNGNALVMRNRRETLAWTEQLMGIIDMHRSSGLATANESLNQ